MISRPGPCSSSGTGTGAPKPVPLTVGTVVHLRRLRDRVSPLPRFAPSLPLRELPEELYGGGDSVRRLSRLHQEGFVLSLSLFLALALLGTSVSGPLRLLVVSVLVLDVSALSVLVVLAPSTPLQVALRRVRRCSRRSPDGLPALLVSRPRLAADLGRCVPTRLARHLSSALSPDQRETALVLAEDGFDGSVGELVSLARLLVPAPPVP